MIRAVKCTAAYHRPKTWAEFVRITVNRRPWPDAGTIVGECPKCRSTISWALDEEGNIPMKRNPVVGEHPDLFEEGQTPIFKPLSELTHEEIVALPRRAFRYEEWTSLDKKVQDEIFLNETMTLHEIIDEGFWPDVSWQAATKILEKIPRDELFEHPDDWDALSDEEKEHFIDNDAESEELIEAVVKPFEQAYESANNPDAGYLLDSVDTDYFSQWLQEQADHLVELARDKGWSRNVDSIVEEHTADGYSEEQVLQAIDEALRETDNYEKSVSDSGFFTESVSTGWMSVDAPWKAAEKLFPHELEVAAKKIEKVTESTFGRSHRRNRQVSPDNLLDKNHTFEAEWETENYVAFDPDWHLIEQAVTSALEDIEPEEAEGEGGEPKPKKIEKPLEERVVHRFKDGSFVVELLPREMIEEGAPYACDTHGHFYPAGELFAGGPSAPCPTCDIAAPRSESSLHMCIGAPSQRYVKTAKKGTGKAWSLRTQGGKKKIAIFADLKPDGSIRRIDQAKGKHNRLPGFEASKHGGSGREGKFKPTEVVQVAEFIASLDIDPYTVNDVALGMRQFLVIWAEDKGTREITDGIKALSNISPAFKREVETKWADILAEPSGAVRRRAIDLLPRENPARRPRVCRHCGGEAGGFCG